MDRAKKIIKTSILGIVVNVILVIFKAIVGFIANSIAIILDAINNLTDAISQVVTIVGTKLSNKAPTKKHPYGYGRIEYVTSQIVAAIIISVGVISLKEAIEKIINPDSDITYTTFSFIIISVAIVVKFVYGLYVRAVGKKLSSTALVGTGLDALFDSLLSTATLVTAIIAVTTDKFFEGYAAALISIMIVKSGIDLMRESIGEIIGNRTETELAKKLKDLVLSYDNVKGAYDLVLHDYGPNKSIGSVHIEVSDTTSALEIHRITRAMTKEAYSKYGIILTVGIYAANSSVTGYKELFENEIKLHKEIIQYHGFYVDLDTKKISIDLVFDFDTKNQKEILDQIYNNLSKQINDFTIDLIVDNDFTVSE